MFSPFHLLGGTPSRTFLPAPNWVAILCTPGPHVISLSVRHSVSWSPRGPLVRLLLGSSRTFPIKGMWEVIFFFRLCILVSSRYWFLHWKLFPSGFWGTTLFFFFLLLLLLLSHFADEKSYSPSIGYNPFSLSGNVYDPLVVLRVLRSHLNVTWGLSAAPALASVQWLGHRLRSLTVWVQVPGFHSLALASGKLLFFVPVSSSLLEMVVPTSQGGSEN